jgi:hypothetical protein
VTTSQALKTPNISEIKAEAAESYKKELLAASTQQVEEPEEESEESGGGEK